jgi:hypothetical protein
VSQNHPGSPTWLHLAQPTTDAAMAAVKRALVMAMVLLIDPQGHKIESTLESGKSVMLINFKSLQLISFKVQTPSTAAMMAAAATLSLLTLSLGASTSAANVTWTNYGDNESASAIDLVHGAPAVCNIRLTPSFAPLTFFTVISLLQPWALMWTSLADHCRESAYMCEHCAHR